MAGDVEEGIEKIIYEFNPEKKKFF